jgi:hypothetical protein
VLCGGDECDAVGFVYTIKNKIIIPLCVAREEMSKMSECVSSDSVQTIPLDEIASGATVRFTIFGGVQYLSVRDFIMHMCDKDTNMAGEIWRRLSSENKSELQASCLNFKFPGRGQSPQPVITFPGAIKLAMFLPGENAKKNRSLMAQIIVRYYAGDPTLIREIEANAMSDAPIPHMARVAIVNDDEDGTIGMMNDREGLKLKRKREELELLKLEAEIRALNSNSEATARKSQIEMAQAYTDMCTNTAVDEHARNIFKVAMLNTLQKKAIPDNKTLISTKGHPAGGCQSEHVRGPGTISKVRSVAWPSTIPLVDQFMDLKDMVPDNDYEAGSAQKLCRIKELQPKFKLPPGSPNIERKFRVLGFQYVGPRITSSALSACKHVQEAYGVKRDGKQSVILVMNNSNGIRPQRLWVVLYRLELIPCYASLINMSLYKIGYEPYKDDVILDAIKAPAEDKWSWHMLNV